MPGLTCFINFLITDIVIKSSHAKILIPLTIVYAPVNYYITIKNGEPVYNFLHWKDETTIYVIIGLYIATTATFVTLSKLTTFIKRSGNNEQKSTKQN